MLEPAAEPIAKSHKTALTLADREWLCAVLSGDGEDGSAKVAEAREHLFAAIAAACDLNGKEGEQLMSAHPEVVKTLQFKDSGKSTVSLTRRSSEKLSDGPHLCRR